LKTSKGIALSRTPRDSLSHRENNCLPVDGSNKIFRKEKKIINMGLFKDNIHCISNQNNFPSQLSLGEKANHPSTLRAIISQG
jgi:hypothetical protein